MLKLHDLPASWRDLSARILRWNRMRHLRIVAVLSVLLFCITSLAAQQNESPEAAKPAEKGNQTAEKSGKLPAEADKAAATKE